ncbi:hypothetical protein BJF92_15520 [Rhizobium rhizosphaerae]|uniref:Alanine dehydrogenase/pyridine nucleotide transhydrogenase N-terminal domain-containing protein n=1 Tax=Xaviernesmea rhizosphaerae TaxID=1672749 RepID=A0A1Q9AM07_9HYPH|nr:hypothetical protein BJF92_15520 [Xaviernesmea rhizosphaerae]
MSTDICYNLEVRSKIGAAGELHEGEARVALMPDSAAQFHKLGHECLIEAGAGETAGFPDDA